MELVLSVAPIQPVGLMGHMTVPSVNAGGFARLARLLLNSISAGPEQIVGSPETDHG
ncbi:hypothetical protein KCP74_25480 (plasmid) [Salmonella enterica subsp. enterica]|nr:hypothetical protein KCP74_25480 [Salmonella enterica subsp. enterica]